VKIRIEDEKVLGEIKQLALDYNRSNTIIVYSILRQIFTTEYAKRIRKNKHLASV